MISSSVSLFSLFSLSLSLTLSPCYPLFSHYHISYPLVSLTLSPILPSILLSYSLFSHSHISYPLSSLPQDAIHYYLHNIVFPRCLRPRPKKLSTSGLSLGDNLLFKQRYILFSSLLYNRLYSLITASLLFSYTGFASLVTASLITASLITA